MKSKKGLLLSLILVISLFLSGCGTQGSKEETSNDKITIYTTSYVLADFTQKIGEDNVEVINIIPPGVSSHDYEPSAKDMGELTKGDMFIYNGAAMERWLENTLKNLEGEDIKLVDASHKIEVAAEEEIHDEADEGDEHQDEEGHEHEADSHVWLNPLNALVQAEEIKNALVEIDSENKSSYEANFEEFASKIFALDEKYRIELEDTKRKDFFVSHGAFGYLANRYGLVQNSISGIVPSDEPSPAELKQLVDEAKELNVKYILVDPADSKKLSTVLANEIGAEQLEIYTIDSLTEEQINQGIGYFELMETNLEVLKKALNE